MGLKFDPKDNIVYELGIEKGREEGIKKTIIDFLKVKFTKLPPEIITAIKEVKSLKKLEKLKIKIFQAETLATVREIFQL